MLIDPFDCNNLLSQVSDAGLPLLLVQKFFAKSVGLIIQYPLSGVLNAAGAVVSRRMSAQKIYQLRITIRVGRDGANNLVINTHHKDLLLRAA